LLLERRADTRADQLGGQLQHTGMLEALQHQVQSADRLPVLDQSLQLG
jgi:hypothetical protein